MERIRLGFPDASLHEASAAAVARVLEAHELEVDTVRLPPGCSEAELDAIDLFACAWLPLTDAPLLLSGHREPLGLLYRPAFIWCVAVDGPVTIGDLLSTSDMDRRILVGSSGPASALAATVMKAYGLEIAGYHVEIVADAEAIAWAQDADPRRVVPLCRPHDLLHASGLRALTDPLAALGPEQEARLLIRHDVREALDSDLMDELDELTLGNKVVSAMAYAMRVDAMSAEEAADAWQRGKLTPRA